MPPAQSKKQTHKIHPTPFKSSSLAIPPSPFSPRTPLFIPSYPFQPPTKPYPTPDTHNLPASPLPWLWQCHQCRRTYALSVTRRCLDDGHHFCAGTTTIKNWRKPVRPGRVKRHRACASEFDYQGWKAWGRWRRSGRRDSIYEDESSSSSDSTSEDSEDGVEHESMNWETRGRSKSSEDQPVKDCWNLCDYPSECRWGRRFGVHTPVVTEFPAIEVPPAPAPEPAPVEGILKPENCKIVKKEKKADRTDFWGALVASASRRKSIPPSSPLAAVDEELPSAVEPEIQSRKDGDGDIIMMTIDPALLGQKASEPVPIANSSAASTVASALSPVVTLKDILHRKRTKVATKAPLNSPERKEDKGSGGRSVIPSEAPLHLFDFELAEKDEVVAALPALTRVKSRDSGYHSTVDL